MDRSYPSKNFWIVGGVITTLLALFFLGYAFFKPPSREEVLAGGKALGEARGQGALEGELAKKEGEKEGQRTSLQTKAETILSVNLSFSKEAASQKKRYLSQASLLLLSKRRGRGRGFEILKKGPLSKLALRMREDPSRPNRVGVSIAWDFKQKIPTHLLVLDQVLYSKLQERERVGERVCTFGTLFIAPGSRPKIHFSCPGRNVENLGFRLFPPYLEGNKDFFAWRTRGDSFKLPMAVNPGALFSIFDLRGGFALKESGKSFKGRTPLWEVPLVPVLSFEVVLKDAITKAPIPGWDLRIKARNGKELHGQGSSNEEGIIRVAINPKKGNKMAWGKPAEFFATTKEGFSLPLGNRVLQQKDEPDQFLVRGLGRLELILSQKQGKGPLPEAFNITMRAGTGPCKGQSRQFLKAAHFPNTPFPFFPSGTWRLHVSALDQTHFLRHPSPILIQPGQTTKVTIQILRPWTLEIALKGMKKRINSQNLRLFSDPGGRLVPDLRTSTVRYVSSSGLSGNFKNQRTQGLPILVSKPFHFDRKQKVYSFYVPSKPAHYTLQVFFRRRKSPRAQLFPGILVRKDGERKNIELPKTGSLHLFTDPPIPKGFPLYLFLKRSDGLLLPSALNYMYQGLSISSEDGITLDEIPVGHWQVGVKSGPSNLVGLLPQAFFEIKADQKTEVGIDFFSNGWMPLKGRALDENGRPLKKAWIHIYRNIDDGWPGDEVFSSIPAKEGGEFSVPFLRPGKYVLGAFLSKEGKLRYATSFVIHPRLRDPSSKVFTFPKTGELLLLDSHHAPLEGVRCRIWVGGKPYLGPIISNAKGRAFANVPPFAFLLKCQLGQRKWSFQVPPYRKRKGELWFVLK